VTSHREPVSALAGPSELPGVRTMFTGLHHFGRRELTAILRSAPDARVSFRAAEATHRLLRGLLVTLPISLLVLVLMPRVRPRRTLPLLMTSLPPVLPLLPEADDAHGDRQRRRQGQRQPEAPAHVETQRLEDDGVRAPGTEGRASSVMRRPRRYPVFPGTKRLPVGDRRRSKKAAT
jgi:hypothetical protein